MKYQVSCYNGGPIFGFDWVLIKPDEAVVEVEAESEADAISGVRSKIVRDYYKVIRVL